jgi:hypothetical protein
MVQLCLLCLNEPIKQEVHETMGFHSLKTPFINYNKNQSISKTAGFIGFVSCFQNYFFYASTEALYNTLMSIILHKK